MLNRLFALVLVTLLCCCSAPPPPVDDQQLGRPPRDSRTLDALVIDIEGKATWLVDLILRGSSPFYEDDDWYFFEVEVRDKKPVVKRFRDLLRVYIGPVRGKKIRVTLIPRQGEKIVGMVSRRSYLEGRTEFGNMTIKLRDVQQISFGGDRERSVTEKNNPRAKSDN
jgi:hypothetical protein